MLEIKSTARREATLLARLLPYAYWAVKGLKIHELGQNISNKFSIWDDSALE